MGPEVKTRGKNAGALSVTFRQHIVPKAKLTIAETTNIVDSIIVSSLLHNAHTWCNLTKTNIVDLDKRLASADSSAVPKHIMRIDNVFHKYTDKHVSTLVHRHNAENQIRRKRFMFSVELLIKAVRRS